MRRSKTSYEKLDDAVGKDESNKILYGAFFGFCVAILASTGFLATHYVESIKNISFEKNKEIFYPKRTTHET